MKRLASSLALVSGLSCGGPRSLQPVKPQVYAMSCEVPLFVGSTYERVVTWYCNLGEEGRRGRNTDGRCIGAITTTASCPDGRCTTEVRAVPKYQGYYGENRIAITPTSPGPIEAWAELHHEVGLVERHRLVACEAAAPPTFALSCRTRDTATGAYVPCPADIPGGSDVQVAGGSEIHLETTVTIEGGTLPLPRVELRLDDKDLHETSEYERADADCTRTDDASNPRSRSYRCTIAAAKLGGHRFEVEVEPLPPRALTFVVRP